MRCQRYRAPPSGETLCDGSPIRPMQVRTTDRFGAAVGPNRYDVEAVVEILINLLYAIIGNLYVGSSETFSGGGQPSQQQ